MDTQLTRNVGAKGGDIAGIPVITSANTPSDGDSPCEDMIILIDAGEIFMNEGGIELDAKEHHCADGVRAGLADYCGDAITLDVAGKLIGVLSADTFGGSVGVRGQWRC